MKSGPVEGWQSHALKHLKRHYHMEQRVHGYKFTQIVISKFKYAWVSDTEG